MAPRIFQAHVIIPAQAPCAKGLSLRLKGKKLQPKSDEQQIYSDDVLSHKEETTKMVV